MKWTVLTVTEEVIGSGKRAYYLARSELARKQGLNALANHFAELAGCIPLEGTDNE